MHFILLFKTIEIMRDKLFDQHKYTMGTRHSLHKLFSLSHDYKTCGTT